MRTISPTVWLMAAVLVSAMAAPQRGPGDTGLQQGSATRQMPRNYNYAWAVDDAEYENYYGHQEAASNGRVEGTYYVWLPDRRLMRVDYYVDGESGYVPSITYQDAFSPSWGQGLNGR